MQKGQIILLNGVPRSGKSSIAAYIQEHWPGLWMHLGVDHYRKMTPKKYQPGIGLRPGGERPDLEPFILPMYTAMYQSIAMHSRLGIHIVVDVGQHDHYTTSLQILNICAKTLQGLPVLFAGIHCPPDVIMKRRIATWGQTDNQQLTETIQKWQQAVHHPGIYDVELDTSMHTPKECAGILQKRLQTDGSRQALWQAASYLKGNTFH